LFVLTSSRQRQPQSPLPGASWGGIHQFMPEIMPEIMPFSSKTLKVFFIYFFLIRAEKGLKSAKIAKRFWAFSNLQVQNGPFYIILKKHYSPSGSRFFGFLHDFDFFSILLLSLMLVVAIAFVHIDGV
jgi:hypothetical protein